MKKVRACILSLCVLGLFILSSCSISSEEPLKDDFIIKNSERIRTICNAFEHEGVSLASSSDYKEVKNIQKEILHYEQILEPSQQKKLHNSLIKLYDQAETCSLYLSLYFEEKEQEIKKRQAEEQRRQEVEQKMEAEYKKYGFHRCPLQALWMYVARGINPPKNCIVVVEQQSMLFSVMQQVSDGTIMNGSLNVSYLPNMGSYTFYVENSPTDMALTDDELIPAGLFVSTGNYQYYSILGARKTLPKFKRLK